MDSSSSSRCALLIIIVVAKTAVVVPQQSAFVVERLGKYSGTLGAGFHILVPFLDVVRYKHSLKEQAIDIPPQICITRDNVQVSVDGVLYHKSVEPRAGFLRHRRLQFRHHPAGANHAAQRARQDRARSHLRGAHQHQHPGGQRIGQGVGTLGHQSDALRDQEYHAAAGYSRRHGKTDARRARKTRADPDFGRPDETPRSTARKARSSRRSKPRRERSSSKSTKPKERPRRSSRSPMRPPTASEKSPKPSSSPAVSRRCNYASPKIISSNSANWPRPATR